MELEAVLLERVETWERLSRWEKSELGKDLRRTGLSYGEIMGMIPVKKSTLATWCREVRLADEQYVAIRVRTGSREGIPRDTNRKRRAEIEMIKAQASLEAIHLQDDPLWTAGVALYWGEGFKTQSTLGMANADPHALRLFMSWADAYVPPATGYRARLNLHADNDESAARAWWADQLGLGTSEFTNTFIKPDGTGHRKNHMPHGVCLVNKRRSADAFHTTMVWVEFMQEWFGR
ncbi:MAG: hypothetical protein WD269_10835 [Acidimicrobiia bacterium]